MRATSSPTRRWRGTFGERYEKPKTDGTLTFRSGLSKKRRSKMKAFITAYTPDGVWEEEAKDIKSLKKALNRLPEDTLDLDVRVFVGKVEVPFGGYYLLRQDILPV